MSGFCKYRLRSGPYKGEFCDAPTLPKVNHNAPTIIERSCHNHSLIHDHKGVHAYKPLGEESKFCYFHQKVVKQLEEIGDLSYGPRRKVN